VTGITISTKQVEIAKRLTKTEADKEVPDAKEDADGFFTLGKGKVKFLELDAEKMGDFFSSDEGKFDAVWISEALSHFPDKALFFRNTAKVLKPGGKLALADWFKAEGLGDKEFTDDIKPIEGMFFCALLATGEPGYADTSCRRHAAPSSLHSKRVRQARHRCWATGARWTKGYQRERGQDVVSPSATPREALV